MGDLGAVFVDGDACRFRVWAPGAGRAELLMDGRAVALERADRGYHETVVEGVRPGARYRYVLDGGEPLPDPASRHQPEGVHGPSAVVDPRAHRWSDTGWFGRPLGELVVYELHVGTFTADGTLDAAIAHLDDLADLGVTAVELMPLAEFPGSRNWGYDGVFPYAVQSTYGGPDALRRFADACHAHGLALIADVVYNHLGPEGNRLADFGPYFTDRYATPWGAALNFDGPDSDEVRRYFLGNARMWFEEYHADGLRLDAIHGIYDASAWPFLRQLAEATERLSDEVDRRLLLIAESDRNDPAVVRPPALGGLGLDAQWTDDFHHALHALTTGERDGYYGDYGSPEDLARAYRDGFVYARRWSAYRRRSHGAPADDLPGASFVVCAQNHDQIGNRMRGERLPALVDLETVKLSAAAVLLAPFVPLLFMGEEYAELAPFPYFVSHTDPALVEAVRRGRREEFAAFGWRGEPPDPQDDATFASAKLDRSLAGKAEHAAVRELYKELLRLRRTLPALRRLDRDRVEASCEGSLVTVRRRHRDGDAVLLCNFGHDAFARADGAVVLDTADVQWSGPGASGRVGGRYNIRGRSAVLLTTMED